MSKMTWYTLDSDQKPEFHEPVDLSGALKIFNKFIADYKINKHSIDDLVIKSMFGFMRSERYFMEIYIKGINDFIISYQLQNVEPDISNGKTFMYQNKISSKHEMQKRIHQFFTLSHEELIKRLK